MMILLTELPSFFRNRKKTSIAKKKKKFLTFEYILKTLKYFNLMNIKNLIKQHLLFMPILSVE